MRLRNGVDAQPQAAAEDCEMGAWQSQSYREALGNTMCVGEQAVSMGIGHCAAAARACATATQTERV